MKVQHSISCPKGAGRQSLHSPASITNLGKGDFCLGEGPPGNQQLQSLLFCVFFSKEGHASRRQRKAATQASKTSVRAPRPRRRAGKGAFDRAAR